MTRPAAGDTIVPFHEAVEHFGGPEKFALELGGLAARNSAELAVRNMTGVTRRYATDHQTAVDSVNRALDQESGRETGPVEVHHFAVLGSLGQLMGTGSIIPDLPLVRPYFGMPRGLSERLHLQEKFEGAGFNVQAWTDSSSDRYGSLLATAYRDLRRRAKAMARERGLPERVWTLEPARSRYAREHMALARSGLYAIPPPRRFSDGEDNRHRPPNSWVYSSLLPSAWKHRSGS